MNKIPWYFGVFNPKIFEKESEKMSANDLEQFRIRTYAQAQADLAEKLKFMILKGDYVDVMNAIDEALEKGKEVIE